MPTLTQRPTVFTITLTVERNAATPEHLVTYLERALRKAMQRAQFTTPAASKLLDVKITHKDAK